MKSGTKVRNNSQTPTACQHYFFLTAYTMCPHFRVFSDRNRGLFLCLSENEGCVRYTSAESRPKVWNEAKNRITFAPSKQQSDDRTTKK